MGQDTRLMRASPLPCRYSLTSFKVTETVRVT